MDCLPTPDDLSAPALCRRHFRYCSNLVSISNIIKPSQQVFAQLWHRFCTLHCGHLWTWPHRLTRPAPSQNLCCVSSLFELTLHTQLGTCELCELCRDQDLEASSLRPSDSWRNEIWRANSSEREFQSAAPACPESELCKTHALWGSEGDRRRTPTVGCSGMQEWTAVQYTTIVRFQGTKRDCTVRVGCFCFRYDMECPPNCKFCQYDAKPSSVE